ncbi:hypothetical protein R1flu_011793 [Riccia fluitans]|uniref:Uncharacterized protein n=1 Tax=Riccia fluitans TaxID=41844 RepID=A0ABD1Z957_9MARC
MNQLSASLIQTTGKSSHRGIATWSWNGASSGRKRRSGLQTLTRIFHADAEEKKVTHELEARTLSYHYASWRGNLLFYQRPQRTRFVGSEFELNLLMIYLK